mmetsp:Transcript_121081/g.353835  ORF Transcript_121081/g.353835 Transcript_121081/m.353835 type:complete len:402 (-) Transcript_121081:255-1460(-)
MAPACKQVIPRAFTIQHASPAAGPAPLLLVLLLACLLRRPAEARGAARKLRPRGAGGAASSAAPLPRPLGRQRQEPRQRRLRDLAPGRQDLSALWVTFDFLLAAQVCRDLLVVDELAQERERLALAVSGHLDLLNDAWIQDVAEHLPGVDPCGRSPDHQDLRQALRHHLVPVLHEPVEGPGRAQAGLVETKAIAILNEDAVAHRHVPAQAVLFARSQGPLAMDHVQLLKLLKGHSPHQSCPVAARHALVGNHLAFPPMPEEATAQPPGRQALLVRVEVPARERVVDLVVLPPPGRLSEVLLSLLDLELARFQIPCQGRAVCTVRPRQVTDFLLQCFECFHLLAGELRQRQLQRRQGVVRWPGAGVEGVRAQAAVLEAPKLPGPTGRRVAVQSPSLAGPLSG